MFEEFKENWLEFWHGLSAGQKTSFIFLILFLLTALCGSIWWLFSKQYEVLFAELSEKDAAAIIEELSSSNVDYKLEMQKQGSRILVDENVVHETRLKLAGSGVPIKGGVGFELFDDADYGMTDFAQKINYQRAMQGELSRTISAFPEVKYARIHLVLPKSSLFKKSDSVAKASVTLILERDKQISGAQVQGIQRLVAASIDGLDASMVTVLDQHGMTLSRDKDSEDKLALNRWDHKQQVENYLSAKALLVLERIYGVDQSIVNIDVQLNYDQIQRTTEALLTPEGQDKPGVLIKTKETKTVKHADSGKESEAARQSQIVNSSTETSYEVGKQIEQVVVTAGNIVGLSVSVLVPASASADDMASLQQLIAAAVGLEKSRGDTIEIHAIPLSINPPVKAIAADTDIAYTTKNNTDRQASSDQVFHWLALIKEYRYWVIAVIAGLVVILFALLILLFKKPVKALSVTERESLLKEIKAWLAEDTTGSRQV